MDGITPSEFNRLCNIIIPEIKPLQEQLLHINPQIADLIGHNKAGHRGYWANESWRNDPELSPRVRAQIIKLVSRRKKLARVIQRKYAALGKLHKVPIVVNRKRQKKSRIKRRK